VQGLRVLVVMLVVVRVCCKRDGICTRVSIGWDGVLAVMDALGSARATSCEHRAGVCAWQGQ
jgi:hypothetical protein